MCMREMVMIVEKEEPEAGYYFPTTQHDMMGIQARDAYLTAF